MLRRLPFPNTAQYITRSDSKMFIAPFPIIFLQIKVSLWHLFPWQRHRYFTHLPSALNLSGYENSSCVFSPPVDTLVLSVQPLKPSSWCFLLSDLKEDLVFLLLSFHLVLSFFFFSPPHPPIVCLKGLPVDFHMWRGLLICGIKKELRCQEQTLCLLDFVS